MPSLFKSERRWCVQINEVPDRPCRFFRLKESAEEFRTDVRDALDRCDSAELDRLLPMRPVEDAKFLVEQWLLTGKATRTTKQTTLKHTRIRSALDFMEVQRAEDLCLQAAAGYIRSRSGKESSKTTNERVSLLRSFGSWLLVTGRTKRDELVLLARVDQVPTYQRAALRPTEIARILEGTRARWPHERLQACPGTESSTLNNISAKCEERTLVIALCFAACLRIDEARRLTWKQLTLDERRIDLTASVKTRRPERAFLPTWVVARLRTWRDQVIAKTGVSPDRHTRVFDIDTQPHRWFKRDATFAGFHVDDPDEMIDPHCLRHSIATLLAEEGIDPFLADLFTRHAPQGSTRARVYVQARAETMLKIADRIPDVLSMMGESEDTPRKTVPADGHFCSRCGAQLRT